MKPHYVLLILFGQVLVPRNTSSSHFMTKHSLARGVLSSETNQVEGGAHPNRHVKLFLVVWYAHLRLKSSDGSFWTENGTIFSILSPLRIS